MARRFGILRRGPRRYSAGRGCTNRQLWHYLDPSGSGLDDPHAAARAALPPAERTLGDQHCLRSGNVSGARAPAPAGAPLHAAHPFGDPRRGAHHAAARQPQGGARLRAEARRLDRGAAWALAGGAGLRARQRDAAARSRSPHRAQTRPARHGLGRGRQRRRAAAMCRRRSAACGAADFRLPQARGQERSGSGQPAGGGGARRQDQTRFDPRPIEPLGLVLDHGRTVLFLAAYSGAAFCA